MKISIIGAGNVGSTLASRILARGLADVVLVDVALDFVRAKALDLCDAMPLVGHQSRVVGTDDYGEAKASEIVVVTAGFPRRPGMSREDLVQKNSGIIKSVIKNIKKAAPRAILIVVTNPLDIMTYLAYKEMGCDRKKILGMAGNLDTSRFKTILSQELNVPNNKIETYVLGSHGDTMVPLVSRTVVDGKPLKRLLDKEKLEKLLSRTKKRGAEIVGLLKSGSAYFSPSAACMDIINAITKDENRAIPCSCILDGEYGLDGCAVGVPAKIGKNGVTEILEWDLSEHELGALRNSAEVVRKGIGEL